MKRFFHVNLAAALFILPLLAASLPVWAFEMKAGAAKTVITPEDYESRHRIAVMGSPLEGLNRDIHARALVLNDGSKRLVIVTYDLNCLDVATPILRKRCRDELGIDPAYLLLMATHNHAAPIQIVPDNFDYGRWLADKIFELIKNAISKERGPARIFFGVGEARLVMNLDTHELDTDIQVLKVECDGETMALLFNQASHPIQASFTKTGAGHPGYAMDEVEKMIPGAQAMYAAACGGNQFIKLGFVMWAPKPLVKLTGRRLARKVVEISEGPLTEVTGPISSRLEVISLPLAPPMPYDEAVKLAEGVPMDIGFVPYPEPDRETNWIRALIKHYDEGIPFPTRTTDMVCTDDAFLMQKLPEPREFPCVYEETIVAGIGPMALISMQGEVCAPIGMRIKDRYRDDMPVMVFAYMGEHNLYIPTRELIRLSKKKPRSLHEIYAYQPSVLQTQYACPVEWDPDVEDEMVEGVVRMMDAMNK